MSEMGNIRDFITFRRKDFDLSRNFTNFAQKFSAFQLPPYGGGRGERP